MNEKSIQLAALLTKAGIAHKECKVFGSHLILTCYSETMATKAGNLLSHAWRIDKIGPAYDYAKENKHSTMRPTMLKVWRVWAHL